MNKNNFVFDLGFHNGDDTDFYLKKGFNVVAVEANPALVKEGICRFDKYIKNNRLILLNRLVSDIDGEQNFYIHPEKSDWSSSDKKMAESDGTKSNIITVKTISFNELCKKFNTPRYAKIDIEGCDLSVARQLYNLKNKPQYISFEISKKDYAGIFSWLFVSGYKKFQLINQMNNVNRRRDVQLEGKDIKYNFTKYSSGFFGRDLLDNKWLTYEDALSNYNKYRDLKLIDNQELALGWLDLHASL